MINLLYFFLVLPVIVYLADRDHRLDPLNAPAPANYDL